MTGHTSRGSGAEEHGVATCLNAGQPRLVVDTPGTNGLTPHSDDERVARDMLLRSTDADVLQVGDTNNLRRTVLLSLQLAEHGVPFTLCLNMSDETRGRDSSLVLAQVAGVLGVPVVSTSALRRWNLRTWCGSRAAWPSAFSPATRR